MVSKRKVKPDAGKNTGVAGVMPPMPPMLTPRMRKRWQDIHPPVTEAETPYEDRVYAMLLDEARKEHATEYFKETDE